MKKEAVQRFKRRFGHEPTKFGDVQLVLPTGAPDVQKYFDNADKGTPEPFACTMVFPETTRRSAKKQKNDDACI